MNSQRKNKNIPQQAVNKTMYPLLRDFKVQLVTNSSLDLIINKSFQMIKRNENLNKVIEQQKLQQSQTFTRNNCGQIIQNFFIQSSDLSPEISEQKCLVSPSKPKSSFLNYEQFGKQTEHGSTLHIKRQKWETRRDSKKIYNCNKIYILKKSHHNDHHNDQTMKSIRLNQTTYSGFSNKGRFSHREDLRKFPSNQNLVTRHSIRGRLTTNPFHKENQNGERKNQYLKNQSSPLHRSSFYQCENPIQQDISQKILQIKSKVIKLQQPHTSFNQSFQKQQSQKQTNNYIAFLRERKQKLDTIMKAFDTDQQVKKKHKIQRQLLIKENQKGNLAETFSKMPQVTTDYEGNLIYLKENVTSRKNSTQKQNLKKNKSNQLFFPKFQPYPQGSIAQNISFKVKDIDDKTKIILNQIFSSARGTPSRSTKKIMFNTNNNDLNRTSNQKFSKRQRIQNSRINNTSLVESRKKIDNSNRTRQPSIKAFQSQNEPVQSKKTRLFYKNLKSVLKMSTKYLKNNIKQQNQQLNKQNIFNNVSNVSKPEKINKKQNIFGQNLKEENKVRNHHLTLMSEPTYRKQKKNENSLIELQKLYRQQYHMKRDRNNQSSKKIIRLNTNAQFTQIPQASNQNSERNSIVQNCQNGNIIFDILLKNVVK